MATGPLALPEYDGYCSSPRPYTSLHFSNCFAYGHNSTNFFETLCYILSVNQSEYRVESDVQKSAFNNLWLIALYPVPFEFRAATFCKLSLWTQIFFGWVTKKGTVCEKSFFFGTQFREEMKSRLWRFWIEDSTPGIACQVHSHYRLIACVSGIPPDPGKSLAVGIVRPIGWDGKKNLVKT